MRGLTWILLLGLACAGAAFAQPIPQLPRTPTLQTPRVVLMDRFTSATASVSACRSMSIVTIAVQAVITLPDDATETSVAFQVIEGGAVRASGTAAVVRIRRPDGSLAGRVTVPIETSFERDGFGGAGSVRVRASAVSADLPAIAYSWTCLALAPGVRAPAETRPPIDRVEALSTQANASWSDTAANYRIVLRGSIGEGVDGVRREDFDLQVNVVMRNGLVVRLRNNGSGVITNSGDPARRVFHLNISGKSPYVTDLDVAFVEVIHLFKGFRVNESTNAITDIIRMNYAPDQWDFVNIQLSGRLYRRNPATGVETLVSEREVLNARPQRRMTYGIWASAPPPANFEPPPQIQDAQGRVTVRVLTGGDDMRRDPADAALLIETPDARLRHPLGRYVGLPAYSFWNHDAFIKFDQPVQWNRIGRTGLFYRFGDHGPFERDDWEVRALLVEFCPDLLRSSGICFRKASHYVYGNDSAYLVRMNGDGSGMETWAPFH